MTIPLLCVGHAPSLAPPRWRYTHAHAQLQLNVRYWAALEEVNIAADAAHAQVQAIIKRKARAIIWENHVAHYKFAYQAEHQKATRWETP